MAKKQEKQEQPVEQNERLIVLDAKSIDAILDFAANNLVYTQGKFIINTLVASIQKYNSPKPVEKDEG